VRLLGLRQRAVHIEEERLEHYRVFPNAGVWQRPIARIATAFASVASTTASFFQRSPGRR